MSNIPAPSSGYSDYGYSGGSLRSHFVDDPYGSYGAGDGGYQSADVDAYKQQLQAYYQNLMSVYQSLQAGDPRRAQCQQYLQMSLQYAQQVGLQLQGAPGIGNEWDPNSGVMGGQSLPGTPTYQDSTHCVFDEGNSTSFAVKQSDANTKQFDIYANDNTLQVPSNAASVSVVQTTEGSDVKWEVTITFPNGSTRKVVYHHVDREGFNLDIQTGDTSQVSPDVSVTGGGHADKLTKSELGSGPTSSQQAGDPPTRMDGDNRVYDGSSFDISPVPDGTNKETKVLASGDVTITPNSNEEIYVMDYQATPAPAQYIVKVYANEADKAANKIKETITIDAALVDHISFAGDPSRITYGDGLCVLNHPDQLDTGKTQAAKITAADSSIADGMPLDPNNLTDTAPNSSDRFSGVATYNNSTNVDVHAYYGDEFHTHEITAPGEVTIHGTSFADTMELTSYSEGPPREWTIKVYKDGIHDADHTETFHIKGGANTKIKLDVLDIGSVETHGKSGTAANLEAASIQLAGSEPSS